MNEIKNKKNVIDYTDEFLFKEVQGYADVCRLLNEPQIRSTDFDDYLFDEVTINKLVAFAQLKQIEKLFNGKWIKDWANQRQYKYYPYYNIDGSGRLVFVDSVDRYRYSFGEVAFYKNRAVSDFVGKTFIDIYAVII